jgi:hypothetical protein
MKLLNLKDKNFVNQEYSAMHGASRFIKWDRSCSQPGPVIYTDKFLNDRINIYKGEKIAWVLEPVSIYPHIYTWIKLNWALFKEVWTHDEELINLLPNARWIPMGGTWINLSNRNVHTKTILCSFIASSKNYAPGHKLRQEVRKVLPSFVDQFGAGFRPIRNKAEGLNSYCFSIAIENCIRDTYFTEKIIDCFLTGTVPVYWGTKRISRHFNPAGILQFETQQELMQLMHAISFDMYQEMIEAVRQNYELAKEFETGEDTAFKKTISHI